MPSTVEIMHLRTQGDMNFYAPFLVRNNPLKFVGGLKIHSVYGHNLIINKIINIKIKVFLLVHKIHFYYKMDCQ